MGRRLVRVACIVLPTLTACDRARDPTSLSRATLAVGWNSPSRDIANFGVHVTDASFASTRTSACASRRSHRLEGGVDVQLHARHAALRLPDGTLVVLSGLVRSPTWMIERASVERRWIGGASASFVRTGGVWLVAPPRGGEPPTNRRNAAPPTEPPQDAVAEARLDDIVARLFALTCPPELAREIDVHEFFAKAPTPTGAPIRWRP